MSNPTRETIEVWRAFHIGEDKKHGIPEIFDFASRALDMRESLEGVNKRLAQVAMPSLEEMDELVETLLVIATRFDGTDAKSTFDGAGASPDDSD